MIPFIYHKWYYRLFTGIIAGMLAWLLVEVLLNIQYRYFVLFTDPLKYLQAAAFGIVLLELMTRTNRWLDRRLPWEQNPGNRLLFQTLSGLMIALLIVFALRMLVNFLFYPSRLIIFSDEVTVFIVVATFIIFFNLFEFGYFLNERYRKSMAEMERFRKENAEYQFEMLKLQLNPHFLFNSLNTLSSLVYEDASKASEFIRKLSEVYRYVLDNRDKELVLLSQEMDFLTSFSYLLGLRFQGMIEFRAKVDDSLLSLKIAPMTLQLLVENAVKHNVASRQRKLIISIFSENGEVVVSNNLQPKTGQTGSGMGLKNIRSRYAFLTDHKVQIIHNENTFEVRIPLI
jgi:sensor histidine kinase YesM